MGDRFYTQQLKGKAFSKLTKAPVKQKKDIAFAIEAILSITLPSLIKVTKPTLEVLYDTLYIRKR